MFCMIVGKYFTDHVYLSLLMIVALIIIIVAKKLVFVIRSVKHCLLDRITLINMIVVKLK